MLISALHLVVRGEKRASWHLFEEWRSLKKHKGTFFSNTIMRVFKSAGKTELFEKTLASKPHCARIDTATSKCCICLTMTFHWLKSFANESSSWHNFSTCQWRQEEFTGHEKYNKRGRVNIILQPWNAKVIVTVALDIPSLKKSFREFSESLP